MTCHPQPRFLFDRSLQEPKGPLHYFFHNVLGQNLLVLFSSKVILGAHFLSQELPKEEQAHRFLQQQNLQADSQEEEGQHLVATFFHFGQGTLALKASPFQQKVYLALSQVKKGQGLSYRQLAIDSGHPRAERAVGSAMAQNPLPYFLPCHRVLPSKGGWGSYRYGKALKKQLLLAEGFTPRF